MNTYALIILVFILINLLLDIISEWLNLRYLSEKVPDEFVGIYDEEVYKKSQHYTRETTRFGLLTGCLSTIALLLFWWLGGFALSDEFARSLGYNSILTGLVFFGILIGLQSIFSFPFSIYSTFVIEEKYGFNRTTWKTFILDRLKGILLGLLLGIPLISGILWFFESAGEFGWIIALGVVIVFSLIIQFIAPIWIMPLFNKFTPLDNNDLKTAILNYAESVQFSLKDIFIIDGSKRSNKANAFFTGFGKNKRIALYDTLVEKQTIEEIVAVVAHEIGHYKKKHIILMTVSSFLQTGIMFYLLSIFLTHQGLFEAFGLTQSSVYAGLIFFSLLYSPIETILSIIGNMLSRKHEFEADEYSVKTYPHQESLISALKKLSVQNLSNLTPHPFFVFLSYSHPPVVERIKAMRRFTRDVG